MTNLLFIVQKRRARHLAFFDWQIGFLDKRTGFGKAFAPAT